MAALKRAQIQGCPIVAARKPAPTQLNSPLSGAYTSLARSGQKPIKLFSSLFFVTFFFLNIVSRFSMPQRLAFHCHFLITDLCCLSKICHEYQSSATMNDSTSCVTADINNSLIKYGVEDMCFIFV